MQKVVQNSEFCTDWKKKKKMNVKIEKREKTRETDIWKGREEEREEKIEKKKEEKKIYLCYYRRMKEKKNYYQKKKKYIFKLL